VLFVVVLVLACWLVGSVAISPIVGRFLAGPWVGAAGGAGEGRAWPAPAEDPAARHQALVGAPGDVRRRQADQWSGSV